MSPMGLQSFLSDSQRREIGNVRRAAERILAQPLDHTYTDHTIEHCERIRGHLDVHLWDWAEREVKADQERARAEIFILLAAVYLHDIGMQFQRFEHCRSLREDFPTLAAEAVKRGLARADQDHPFTPETLKFCRVHHHLITYDWIIAANRRSRHPLPFEDTGLKSHVEHVARVSWAHNVWLTNDSSFVGYEHLLANVQEQEGEIRLALLAAFLRLGDILDLDFRRVDLNRLRRFDIPVIAKAHWWRHHFVRTCRLDPRYTDRGRPLHLVLALPEEHMADQEWLKLALYSATIKELEAEQLRLTPWLAPAGVWIDLPAPEACVIREDVSGQIVPMPPEVLEVFRKIWPGAEGDAAQAQIQRYLDDGTLTGEILGDHLRTLGVRVEIEDYLAHVENQHEQGFRETPYTPLEIDYGNFTDALEALEALIEKPDPIPRPIVLVGDPGGGKTTLVRRYVLDCARGLRTPKYLPIYVQANRYGEATWAEAMEKRLGSAREPVPRAQYDAAVAELVQWLLALFAETLCDLAGVSYRHRDPMLRHLLEIMARRTCLIVLDGLNEIPPSQRGLSILAVRHFVAEYPSHRVVITSRQGDYHEDYFPSSPMHAVQPLREEAIRAYWDALGIARSAQDHVLAAEGGAVAELARNPMYMFMLGELLKSRDSGTISDPGQLFQRFTREALYRWHHGDPNPLLDPEEMQDLLSETAFHALHEQAVSFDRSQLARGIQAWWEKLTGERRCVLATAVAEDPGASEAPDITDALRSALLEKMLGTGLLQTQGDVQDPRYKFRHHTSQDYFAAMSIRGKVDQLPMLVGRPVFHEPLRLVPGIIENPNDFLGRLTASTSAEFGRSRLLVLSFQVAGAMRVPLQPEILRQLFAGAVPLLHAAVGLCNPYASEILGDLFSHVGWALLARFLAYIAQNPDVTPFLRSFANERIAMVLTREDAASPQVISKLLGDRIPLSVWADYEACKGVLERESGIEEAQRLSSLLLGGLASSISLRVEEKLRIAKMVGQLTSNQLGLLQIYLIEEILAFGGLSLTAERHDLVVKGLHHEYLSKLLLCEEDALCLQGRQQEAIGAYFAAWSRLAVRYPLLHRLILLSSEMELEQLEKLQDLLELYEGEELGFADEHQDVTTYSSVLAILKRVPKIHERIVAVIDQKQDASDNPWLVLWYDFLLRVRPGRSPRLALRFGELLTGLDCASPAGLTFLQMAAYLPDSTLIEEVRRALDHYHPERPSQRIEAVKKLISELPEDRIAGEMVNQLLNVGFHGFIVEALLVPVLERLDLSIILKVIEHFDGVDQSLGIKARLLLLRKLAREGAVVELERLMDEWGFTLPQIAKQEEDFRSDILHALYSTRKEEILHALGLRRGMLSGDVILPLDIAKVDSLLIELLEKDGRLDEAFLVAVEGIAGAASAARDPRQFFYTARRLATSLPEGTDPRVSHERQERLCRALLPLLTDSANADWAFDELERVRATWPVDLEAYGQRLAEVLMSVYSVIDWERREKMLDVLSSLGQHDLVLNCLDAYLRGCPSEASAAARYHGEGAWCAYLAGDDQRLLSITEAALSLAPAGYRIDWLLGNRAFALLLNGRGDDAYQVYLKAQEAVSDFGRWIQDAIEDLELHTQRRPGATPLPPELIERVRSLGADLPPAPGCMDPDAVSQDG